MNAEAFPHCEWMARDAAFIADLPLKLVALPGSHDAGTWGIDCRSKWCPDRKEWWAPIAQTFACVTARYAKTQNYALDDQAARGIRYFDMRACAYDNAAGTRELRFTHGLLGSDFEDGVRDACAFAREHPSEILIFDMRFTRGFADTDHKRVQEMFVDAAGDRLARGLTPNSFVREFWAANKNIIVIYDRANLLPHTGIWSSKRIATKWPNMTDASAALAFFDEQMTNRRVSKNQLYNLQACLTPTGAWMRRHPFTSTQELAGSINALMIPHIDKWRGKLNCIMVDVVETPGLVDAVLSLNKALNQPRRV